MQEQTSKTPDPFRTEAPLLAVRTRGAFLISALLWAAAFGGALALGGYFIVVFNLAMDAAERVRQGLGLTPPAQGPDWYLVAVMAVAVALPQVMVIGLWMWYRRVWRRRLRRIWSTRSSMARYSGIRSLKYQAGDKELNARASYLNALIATPPWQGLLAPGGPDGQLATLETEEDYRRVSEAVLREIENDVAERAIATGLIVGLGPSRLDRLTIVVAALEMQLHVLSRLGKKPSLGAWRELVKRTSASFFFNTYLSREDTMMVSFAIGRIAMGLGATAEMAEGLADSLGGDSDETTDELLEGVGGIPMAGGFLRTAGTMSLGVGAMGLQQIADLTREAGNELLQGALAGGVLYYHGMAIAADALALDERHRQSPEMTRTPRQGAMRTAGVAGQLLRNQVKRYRGAYRERTRAPLRLVTRYAPRWKSSQNRQGETEGAPQPATDAAPPVSRMTSLTQPWRLLRRSPKPGPEPPES